MLGADLSVRPYVVELLEPYRSEIGTSTAYAPSQRIRSDLWRAVVDYSSSGAWLWSPASETVVNTKAFSMSLNDNRADAWGQRFADWLAEVACDGPGDPRRLPLHIFKTRRAASRELELDSAADRKRFRQVHFRNGVLEDGDRRRWRAAEPGARHGRDPQFVRNQELPLGFHWDVCRSTGIKVETPMSIWKVGQGGHINVYADGHVRPGTGCRLIWDRSRSTSADEADRLGTRL